MDNEERIDICDLIMDISFEYLLMSGERLIISKFIQKEFPQYL